MKSLALLLRLSAASTIVILLYFVALPNFNRAGWLPSQEPTAHNEPIARFHFLTVATGSNLNLCRLILSGAVLSYPPPVLIDWEGTGQFNASESHLAKIIGPLRYLEGLPPSKDHDIALLVDGYDVIFQLGPEVLLRRYFSAIDAGKARLEAQFGAAHVQQQGLHNTILFGPDKTCFPLVHEHPRCWAIPGSPMPGDAFGPATDTDMEHHRPRWINSGTIMGPVTDMRELFRAAWEKVETTYNPDDISHNSDQMYFANMFGEQEFVRERLRSEQDGVPMNVDKGKMTPDIRDGQKTDYHVGLDYDSRLFQTCAGYENFLHWMTFNKPAPFAEERTLRDAPISLEDDILLSKKPFAAINNDAPLSRSWTDVSLGVNVVTGLAFPVLHFTGNKSLRDEWWPRMWFFSDLKRLLLASAKVTHLMIGKINGIVWEKGIPGSSERLSEYGNDGAWSDRGERLSWDRLCGEHEGALYNHG